MDLLEPPYSDSVVTVPSQPKPPDPNLHIVVGVIHQTWNPGISVHPRSEESLWEEMMNESPWKQPSRKPMQLKKASLRKRHVGCSYITIIPPAKPPDEELPPTAIVEDSRLKELANLRRNKGQSRELSKPYVVVSIGVGKSTTVNKIDCCFLQPKFKVMVNACDPFQLGVVKQLLTRALRLQTPILAKHYENEDTDVTKEASVDDSNMFLIHTSSHLQNNEPLLRALPKWVYCNLVLVSFVGETLVYKDAVEKHSPASIEFKKWQIVDLGFLLIDEEMVNELPIKANAWNRRTSAAPFGVTAFDILKASNALVFLMGVGVDNTVAYWNLEVIDSSISQQWDPGEKCLISNYYYKGKVFGQFRGLTQEVFNLPVLVFLILRFLLVDDTTIYLLMLMQSVDEVALDTVDISNELVIFFDPAESDGGLHTLQIKENICRLLPKCSTVWRVQVFEDGPSNSQQWDPGGRNMFFSNYCKRRAYGRNNTTLKFSLQCRAVPKSSCGRTIWEEEVNVRSQVSKLRLEDKSLFQGGGIVRTSNESVGPNS
ncbi:signal recognition particle receptor subunit alpha-like protein [Trifolium pratense]|uniref:Signal recognition particle receptor subunit alpha-like protein n=1 Tax=Trifolium pratense TaxID=57577 RepID=A0A2K3NMK4_TRIPR|nr:signal recognition particle receptor subunit alpha-like protein [Trifolium pratense]